MGIRKFIRRQKGILLTLCLVGVAGYITLNIIAYSLTYKSDACLTCHLIKPYYNNWKSSSHNRVGCIECHPYPPSTILMSSIRYLSGMYNLPLKARVEDKQCVMCHKPEMLKVVDYKGVPFIHLEHIQNEKRGKMLHCTSCHYSVVQGSSHMVVDQNVCVLCHFFTTPPQYNQSCTVCHGQVRKEVKIGEARFSHEPILKTGARCVECHSQTFTGTGEAPEERCRECHIQREAEGQASTRLHMIHITKNYINCFKCHNKMEHGKETVRLSQAVNPSCNECHASSHSLVQDMYMGIGAQEVKDNPSAMYISRIRCTGCHTIEKNIQRKHILSKTWEAKKKSCVLCHKPGYEKMVEDWKKNMVVFTGELTKMLDEYGRILKQQKESYSLINHYRTMEHDLKFLKEGRGEHNVRYAFEIGKSIVAGVQKDCKKMGDVQKVNVPDYLTREDGLCLFCHTTYSPGKEVRIKGLTTTKFNHAQHVEMGTECTKCHDPRLHRMGESHIKESCKECHPDVKF